MPRPGFVLEVDRSTPPTLFWNGEGLSLEKLPPDRSRVIYPAEPLAPIDDMDGAIRAALPRLANGAGGAMPLQVVPSTLPTACRRCCTKAGETISTGRKRCRSTKVRSGPGTRED